MEPKHGYFGMSGLRSGCGYGHRDAGLRSERFLSEDTLRHSELSGSLFQQRVRTWQRERGGQSACMHVRGISALVAALAGIGYGVSAPEGEADGAAELKFRERDGHPDLWVGGRGVGRVHPSVSVCPQLQEREQTYSEKEIKCRRWRVS